MRYSMLNLNKNFKSIALISIGAGLEYYDFIVYGIMINYIKEIFFAAGSESHSTLMAFGILSAGYFARPLGGIIIGILADMYGRKPMLILIMSIMAISTFAIGILPTYEDIGYSATYLLLIFRILQGISFGGELPGAITFANEYNINNAHTRGFYCGIVMTSVAFGGVLASMIMFLLSAYLSTEEIYKYGWRIPFIFGGVLGIISYYIRCKVSETQEFLDHANTNDSSAKIIKISMISKPQYILFAIVINLLAASLVVFNLYLPSYLASYFQYDIKTISLLTTCGIAFASVIAIPCGKLVDKINPINILIINPILLALLSWGLFNRLDTQNLIYPVLLVMMYQIVITLSMVSYFALTFKLFPVYMRYSAISLCYNVSVAISSFCPSVIIYLCNYAQQPAHAAYFYFMCLCILMIVTCIQFKNNTISHY